MQLTAKFIAIVLAVIGGGVGVEAAVWSPGALAVTPSRYATASCPLSPAGREGGPTPITRSPQLVNSIGATGSGWELPACVVWTNPNTGVHTVSPPVMHYLDVSNTQPDYISTGTTLWIYDVDTTNGAELLRVSNVTHEIEHTFEMDPFSKPVIAADGSGLWFGESNQGGPAGSGRAMLYFLGAAASSLKVLLRASSNFASIGQLCYDGEDVWAQVFTHGYGGRSVGYEIDGPGATPMRRQKSPFATCAVSEQYQY
ncbi:MAG TPA: hypothetical protein VNU19_22505 [Candidatus Acidoferrum sp.]|nr:hypothetical protein [Candidatus Acidoferrum sp.]